jgi:tetratricopeptide (TPR) repeat protein
MSTRSTICRALLIAACVAGASLLAWRFCSRGAGGSSGEAAQPLVPESQPTAGAEQPLPAARDQEPADDVPQPPVARPRPPASVPKSGATEPALGASPPSDPAAAHAEIEALKRESLQIAEGLVREYPHTTEGIGLVGTVYLNCGESGKAWECWERLRLRDPRQPDVYIAMAVVALRKGDYEEAADLCRTGLVNTGGTADLYRHLAEALHGMGKPEEAVGALEHAIRMAPGDGDSHYLLGASYAMLNEYAKAKTSYEKAVEIQSGQPRSHYGLAVACAKLGLDKQSQQAMQRYQKLQTASIENQRSQRGVALEVLRYRRMLAATCSHAAAVHLAHQKPEKAEQLLRRGAAVDRQDTTCRAQLVLLCLRSNRDAEALAVCKELITVEPNNATHHLHLAVVYARLRQFDAARLAAAKAVELAPDSQECRRLLQELQGRK